MKTYLLLNDTRFENHWGCEVVVNKIINELKKRNLRYVGSINTRIDFDNYTKQNKNIPDLIVLNGEGTFHHSAPRALELLEISLFYRSKGSKIAFINSVWQENSSLFKEFVSKFDLIYLRESISAESLGLNSAKICPDLVLCSSFQRNYLKGFTWKDEIRRIIGKGISRKILYIDSVVPEVSKRLSEIATKEKCILDHMGISANGRKFSFRSINVSPEDIKNADIVVSGRFHGICFAIKFGKPVVALDSNTHKIDGTLKDLRLNNIPHIKGSFFNENDIKDAIQESLKLPTLIDSDYCYKQATRMFDEVAAMAGY